MKKQPLKVGFDLDGVILYNPIRILRPFVTLFKKLILGKKITKFWIPKSQLEKWLWRLFHKTSLFVAPGFDDVIKLIKQNKIEAYLITGRFSFLKNDLDQWLDKIEAKKYFAGCFYNELDEQPHIFKDRVIKKLKLDVFIEDNWDIIAALKNKERHSQLQIFWIYNFFDKGINYPHKYPYLKKAVEKINLIIGRKKTALLIVSDYFVPHWTGIVKSITSLTQYLKNEIDFTVLTTRYKKNLKENEVTNGVRIIRENYWLKFSRVYYSIKLLIRFCKEVKNHDAVLINSPFSNILPIALIAKIYRKKLFVFHQGDLILPRGLINRVIELIFDFSSLCGCIMADKVSTYTKDYAVNSRILRFFISKFTPIIPPIIITEKFSKNSPTEKKLQKLKKADKIIIGFAGRFVEEKGFDILFRAMPEVIKRIPKAHFVFAGETKLNYENFFDANIKTLNIKDSYFTNLGLLNSNDLTDFYNNLSLIVIPSRTDCFPLVQAEAMLSHIPAVTANIPGARELVRKTGFGALFEKGNHLDLAEKIIFINEKKNNLASAYTNVLKILDNHTNAESFRRFIEG